MKKEILTLALLLLVAIPLVNAGTRADQEVMDEKVNNHLQNQNDYAKLIESDNKVETVCEMIGIEYDSSFDKEMRRVFRAIFHSDGFKAFLRPRTGVRFYGVRSGGSGVDKNIYTTCGNTIIESGNPNIGEPDETCDDGNTINGDGCSSQCQIEVP